MKQFEDVVLVFHEPDCPGVITSDESGVLKCAECSEVVGQLQPRVLRDLIDALEKVKA